MPQPTPGMTAWMEELIDLGTHTASKTLIRVFVLTKPDRGFTKGYALDPVIDPAASMADTRRFATLLTARDDPAYAGLLLQAVSAPIDPDHPLADPGNPTCPLEVFPTEGRKSILVVLAQSRAMETAYRVLEIGPGEAPRTVSPLAMTEEIRAAYLRSVIALLYPLFIYPTFMAPPHGFTPLIARQYAAAGARASGTLSSMHETLLTDPRVGSAVHQN